MHLRLWLFIAQRMGVEFNPVGDRNNVTTR